MQVLYIRISDELNNKLVEDARSLGLGKNTWARLIIMQYYNGGFKLTRKPGAGRLELTAESLAQMKAAGDKIERKMLENEQRQRGL